jgi:molybdopterin/thiamine biosynthesis adenylyltransferase
MDLSIAKLREDKLLHGRQKGFPWFCRKDILMIGAGGINSWAAFLLGRIGHTLYVYDDDIVEPHNIGGQLYLVNQIEQPKVQALKSLIMDSSDAEVYPIQERYVEDSIVSPITILGLDNMTTRKIAVEKWASQKDGREILIDGRLEGEQGIIYTLRSNEDVEQWMNEYFPDDENEIRVNCTTQQTSYNAAIMGGYIVTVFNNHIANKAMEKDIRGVPFKIEYMLPIITVDWTEVSNLKTEIHHGS